MTILRLVGMIPLLYLACLLPLLMARVMLRTGPWRAVPLLAAIVLIALSSRQYAVLWLAAALPPVAFFIVARKNAWKTWETLLGCMVTGALGGMLALVGLRAFLGAEFLGKIGDWAVSVFRSFPEGVQGFLLNSLRTSAGMKTGDASFPLANEALIDLVIYLLVMGKAMVFAAFPATTVLTDAHNAMLGALSGQIVDALRVCIPAWILAFGATSAVLLVLGCPKEKQRPFSDWILPPAVQMGMMIAYMVTLYMAASTAQALRVAVWSLLFCAGRVQGAALFVFWMETKAWPKFWRVTLPILAYCLPGLSTILFLLGVLDPRRRWRRWTDRQKKEG